MNKPALIATICVCVIVDGGLLAWCVWMAGELGKGTLGFFLAGGPPTVLFSPPIYSWFEKQFQNANLQ